MSEIYKDVPGYDGEYQISNFGNVRSTIFRNNITEFRRIKMLNPTDNGRGYLIIGFRKNGKKKNHYIHRLVAEAFVPNPDNKNVVNHIDYNIRNNNFTNLEWCTTKENVSHSSHRMKKPKKSCKSTNTGEKYISYSKKSKKPYRVSITRQNIYKSFFTLSDAVIWRNNVLAELGALSWISKH